MKFIDIPPGTFNMGSPETEVDRSSNETLHQVTLTQGFYLQTTEVTQAQWQAVMENNPSNNSDCANCPVEMVSWTDVQDFINKMNKRGEGTYRLPTEAEWEYAARAGYRTPFNTGDCLSTAQANYDGGYEYAECTSGIKRGETIVVASFSPNALGLYDMHGNVWEWCQDWYTDYASQAVTDPAGDTTGAYRVSRGGSWSNYTHYCRSAFRYYLDPTITSQTVGFRLILSQVNELRKAIKPSREDEAL